MCRKATERPGVVVAGAVDGLFLIMVTDSLYVFRLGVSMNRWESKEPFLKHIVWRFVAGFGGREPPRQTLFI